jgi:hypothetical protein
MQPKLEAPPASSQAFAERDADPAERQADEVGAKIGAELGTAVTTAEGTISDPARTVAERHLGVDLQGAELRADHDANRHASTLGALAVTEGSRVSFAKGKLAPNTPEGRTLIGH